MDDLYDFSPWKFSPNLSSLDDFILCPEGEYGCGGASRAKYWTIIEAGCELCGTHDALKCPLCERVFDHVWWKDTFTVIREECG